MFCVICVLCTPCLSLCLLLPVQGSKIVRGSARDEAVFEVPAACFGSEPRDGARQDFTSGKAVGPCAAHHRRKRSADERLLEPRTEIVASNDAVETAGDATRDIVDGG